MEEKKKQTMEMYRRLTIQIDSLEKEAVSFLMDMTTRLWMTGS